MNLLVFLRHISLISLVGVTLCLTQIIRCRAIGHLTFTRSQVLLAVHAELVLHTTFHLVVLTVRIYNFLILSLILQLVFVVDVAHHILLN